MNSEYAIKPKDVLKRRVNSIGKVNSFVLEAHCLKNEENQFIQLYIILINYERLFKMQLALIIISLLVTVNS